MVSGSCLCGAVEFDIDAPLAPASACHCVQCRKQSGHHRASTHIPKSSLQFTRKDGLRWFQSSPDVRRGFCSTCGSFLFWDPANEDKISVSMGALQAPIGGRLARHIFVGGKGDYYDIGDGLPQSE